jgi:riboflavin kinase / FMN adenylyltransferase
MWITSNQNHILTPTSVALGNFDGIHRGHQQVIKPILSYSRAVSTVMSFYPHPTEFFTGQSKQLLTPLREKIEQLEVLGVDQLVLLPFNRQLSSLTPENFVQNILVEKFGANFVSIGQDFCFGYQRKGTATDLEAIANKSKIKVNITSLQTCHQERISSSLIRSALAKGDIINANRLLGRCYSLTGIVTEGQKLGRTIGFPTANLKINPRKLLPLFGVYLVKIYISQPWPISPFDISIYDWSGEVNTLNQTKIIAEKWGVMNIGNRPTVNGQNTSVEVHLFDCDQDLYGLQLTVNLEQFLRPEQKFSSLDSLKDQIVEDCAKAKEMIPFS